MSPPDSALECWLVWSCVILWDLPQLLWASKCLSSVMSKRHCSPRCFLTFGSYSFYPLFHNVPVPSRGVRTLPRDLISALWPVLAFWVSHYPPHKEAFVMKSESHESMGQRYELEGSLILSPLSRIVIVGSPLEPVTFPTVGSWPYL